MARELHLEDERIDGILIINADGRIDGLNAQDFHNGVDQRTRDFDGAVVLDFDKLTYISSAGLRSVLLIANSFKEKKKKFMLCSLPESALQVIRISGFDKVVAIHESRVVAIAAAME